jgi:hypothetical protein
VTTLRRLDVEQQKYVTVTREKKFPPYLVGGARTQAGTRRKREET